MPDKRTSTEYLQRAALYDTLAQYYKYTNPQYHIHYYLKHLHNINKAIEVMLNAARTQSDASVRILHTSYNSPNIDVYVNGQQLIKDLPFKKISTDLTLKPGKYHIDLYPAGNMVDSVLNKKITVESGGSYTLATIDQVTKMRLLIFENHPSVPMNEAKVRFIHLSPDTPSIDIAVKDRDVVFPNVSYKQATEYLALTPMTIDLEVRNAGTKHVILPMPKLLFKANESYTILLVGLSEEVPELQIVRIID
ncbi:DUF4397 domain-containing protein [Bacillus sp. JJ1764]|uniref:DUF4397 domain-containing protein n=1 Tax=Bacillus sp. JJ1764 TaxID=3122964 RepID=UPI002FFDBEDF